MTKPNDATTALNKTDTVTVEDVRATMDAAYPPQLAEDWDKVGLLCGDPAAPVRKVAFALDCTFEVAQQAVAMGADMLIVHHPLLLRGVYSVAADTPKGKILHLLIQNNVALFAAHTNADSARPGVNDKLAELLGVTPGRPLAPKPGHEDTPEQALGIGRVGALDTPMTLAEFTQRVADRLPSTEWGVRAAGDPDAMITTVAVSSGAGDSFLDTVKDLEVDCFVTSDLRHHPVDEYLAAGGPAVIDTAHWASEFPWVEQAAEVVGNLGLDCEIIQHRTDPWTISAKG